MVKRFNIKSIKMLLLFVIIFFVLITIYNKCKNNNYIQTFNNSINNNYKIIVDVEDSKLYLFNNEVLIKIYRCSGGKTSTPSPIGTWKIISKAKWGEGFRWKFYWY